MTDPLEKRFIIMLEEAGLEYTRPEHDRRDPATLDFYIRDFGLYVEVKQFFTPRLSGQLAKVPVGASIMVLIGPRSVDAFERLVKMLAMRP